MKEDTFTIRDECIFPPIHAMPLSPLSIPCRPWDMQGDFTPKPSWKGTFGGLDCPHTLIDSSKVALPANKTRPTPIPSVHH